MTKKKEVLELKITNEGTYISLKRRIFSAAQVEKVDSLGAARPKNVGLSPGTYPYCPNMGVLPPPG